MSNFYRPLLSKNDKWIIMMVESDKSDLLTCGEKERYKKILEIKKTFNTPKMDV